MNAKNLLPALCLAVGLPAHADDAPAGARLSASSDPAAIMQANPFRVNLRDALTQKPESSALKLANSDFVISGPHIESLRPNRYTTERTPLWKRIALLPIYLITSLTTPWPPGGRSTYFKWKEHSARPWRDVSAGNVGNDTVNFINSEPRTALISVGK
jgi:hypothetical protein